MFSSRAILPLSILENILICNIVYRNSVGKLIYSINAASSFEYIIIVSILDLQFWYRIQFWVFIHLPTSVSRYSLFVFVFPFNERQLVAIFHRETTFHWNSQFFVSVHRLFCQSNFFGGVFKIHLNLYSVNCVVEIVSAMQKSSRQ